MNDEINPIVRFVIPALYVTHMIVIVAAGFQLFLTQNSELGYACGLIIVLSLHSMALTRSLSLLEKRLAAAQRD